jgi:hypothetical protein
VLRTTLRHLLALGIGLQKCPNVWEETLACRGKKHTARAAFQQSRADMILELTDPKTYD